MYIRTYHAGTMYRLNVMYLMEIYYCYTGIEKAGRIIMYR